MGRGSAGPGDLPGATEHGRKPTIAVFYSSEDTVDLLRTALERLVGDSEALEIIGKPYDLGRVIEAVRTALARSA